LIKFNFSLFLIAIYLIVFVLGCSAEEKNDNTSSEKDNITLIIRNAYPKGYNFSVAKPTIYYKKNTNDTYILKSNFINARATLPKGGMVRIVFDTKNENNYYALIEFKHNIQDEDILNNSIKGFQRFENENKEMSIEFMLNNDIEIKTFSLRRSLGLTTLCTNRGKDDVKIFGLNSSFEKENLYENSYEHITVLGNNRYNAYFDLRKIKEKYVLVECYEYSTVKYRAIFNLDEYEFWNYTVFNTLKRDGTLISLHKFRISYLTDLYFRGYKIFLDQGLSHKEAQEKAIMKVKNIFPKYPFKDIGSNASNKITKDYMDSIDKKFENIETTYDYTTEYILEELEKYLFLNNCNNENIKSSFPMAKNKEKLKGNKLKRRR